MTCEYNVSILKNADNEGLTDSFIVRTANIANAVRIAKAVIKTDYPGYVLMDIRKQS